MGLAMRFEVQIHHRNGDEGEPTTSTSRGAPFVPRVPLHNREGRCKRLFVPLDYDYISLRHIDDQKLVPTSKKTMLQSLYKVRLASSFVSPGSDTVCASIERISRSS